MLLKFLLTCLTALTKVHTLALQLADRAIGCRSLHIAGDNLAVVRSAAAQGKLHDPSHEGLIAQPLAALPVKGLIPSWSAIRRRFNSAADRLATIAVRCADQVVSAGRLNPEISTHWYS